VTGSSCAVESSDTSKTAEFKKKKTIRNYYPIGDDALGNLTEIAPA
jgi:hypothetical protein